MHYAASHARTRYPGEFAGMFERSWWQLVQAVSRETTTFEVSHCS